jgi:hypothetical protein
MQGKTSRSHGAGFGRANGNEGMQGEGGEDLSLTWGRVRARANGNEGMQGEGGEDLSLTWGWVRARARRAHTRGTTHGTTHPPTSAEPFIVRVGRGEARGRAVLLVEGVVNLGGGLAGHLAFDVVVAERVDEQSELALTQLAHALQRHLESPARRPLHEAVQAARRRRLVDGIAERILQFGVEQQVEGRRELEPPCELPARRGHAALRNQGSGGRRTGGEEHLKAFTVQWKITIEHADLVHTDRSHYSGKVHLSR